MPNWFYYALVFVFFGPHWCHECGKYVPEGFNWCKEHRGFFDINGRRLP